MKVDHQSKDPEMHTIRQIMRVARIFGFQEMDFRHDGAVLNSPEATVTIKFKKPWPKN